MTKSVSRSFCVRTYQSMYPMPTKAGRSSQLVQARFFITAGSGAVPAASAALRIFFR